MRATKNNPGWNYGDKTQKERLDVELRKILKGYQGRNWNFVVQEATQLLEAEIVKAQIRVLEKVSRTNSKIFQPVGGISNIEYIPKYEITEELQALKDSLGGSDEKT